MKTSQSYIRTLAKNHYKLYFFLSLHWMFLVAQSVRNLPAIREILVRSLGWEDPLEKGMTTDSSILAWRIPGTEDPGRVQSMGSQETDTT